MKKNEKKSINTGGMSFKTITQSIENLHPIGCDCIDCVESEKFSTGTEINKASNKANGSYEKYFDEQDVIHKRSMERDMTDLELSERMLMDSKQLTEENIAIALQKTLIYSTGGGLFLSCMYALFCSFTKNWIGAALSIAVGIFLMIVNERTNK